MLQMLSKIDFDSIILCDPINPFLFTPKFNVINIEIIEILQQIVKLTNCNIDDQNYYFRLISRTLIFIIDPQDTPNKLS